jgi:polyisoprenoid-binding protein YceI
MSTISTQRTSLPTGTWKLDSVHSSIGFSVKHVVGNFRGSFDSFDVTLDEQGLRGATDVSSIDIDEPNLSGHLLSPDFFDAERYPELAFRSNAIAVDGDSVSIDGELTLKGVTKPVTITGTVSGPADHLDGSSRLGLELETVVDRREYGLEWNAPLPTGGFVLGNDVKLTAELELFQKADA